MSMTNRRRLFCLILEATKRPLTSDEVQEATAIVGTAPYAEGIIRALRSLSPSEWREKLDQEITYYGSNGINRQTLIDSVTAFAQEVSDERT